MLCLVVVPSFLLFGYNNGSTGGLTKLESFVKVSPRASFVLVAWMPSLTFFDQQFPAIDTVNTKGAQKSHNSTILGESDCSRR